MKLYIVPGSTNCRKAQAVAKHLDIDMDVAVLNFEKGDLKQPEFLAINPNGKVPVLVDGDFTLWESNPITQYLAESRPGNTLYPADPGARIEIHRWQFWETAHYNRWLGVVAFETILRPLFNLGEPNTAAVEEARGFIARFAPVLEAQLTRGPFVTGETLTLADFSVGSFGGLIGGLDIDLDGFPKIRDWYARLDQIPAWAETVPPQLGQAA
jgi:glutathione S-transferase